MKTLEQIAQIAVDETFIYDRPNERYDIILAALKEAQAMVYEDMKKTASPVTENEKEDEFYRRAEEDLK